MFFLKTIFSLSFGSCTLLKWVNDSWVFWKYRKVSGHFFEVACQLFMPGIPSVSKYIKGITYEVLAHKEPRSSICNELWKILLLLLSVSNYYPAKIMCVIVESNSAFNCFFQKSLARCWKERFEFSRQHYTTFHLCGTQTHRDRPSNWSKLRHAMTFGNGMTRG